MGRNDTCFCGSGKKQKKCHPNISENSIVANLLNTYDCLDNHIKNELVLCNISPACHKGCSDCCYDYFYITEVEYFGILEFLISHNDKFDLHLIMQKAQNYMSTIKNLYPKEYEKISTFMSNLSMEERRYVFDDSSISKSHLPCLFLDEVTKECSIYPVRPIICRLYGICENAGDCKAVVASTQQLVDISLLSSRLVENIDVFKFNGNKAIKRRPYPLADYFYTSLPHYFKHEDLKFDYATTNSIKAYVDLLCKYHKNLLK